MGKSLRNIIEYLSIVYEKLYSTIRGLGIKITSSGMWKTIVWNWNCKQHTVWLNLKVT